MGNANHADIVYCRIRAELIVRLAQVDLMSTSQDRFATATDDPHVSVLTDLRHCRMTVAATCEHRGETAVAIHL